jgi:DNA-binding response OmpR family regulator
MSLWPPRHILLISYDERLLIARRRLFEQEGYNVSSALGLKEALANCNDGAFDLLILGHCIPLADKEGLIRTFRAHSSAPILSLWAHDESVANSVDYLAFSDAPDQLLWNVAAILTKNASPQTSRGG